MKETKILLIFVTLATILVVAPASILLPMSESAEAVTIPILAKSEPKAPMVASGENLYIVWWTNKSGNWEVMFRASNDNGATFGDKINISNSTDTDSENAEVTASGNNVFVSWWENSPTNGTSESVLRASTDNGQTFGPLLMLGTNGTLTTSSE